MVERENIPYLYGKLNQEVKKNTYTGKNTATANTTVNNATNEISVDVKKEELLKNYYTKEDVYNKDETYNKQEIDEMIPSGPTGGFTLLKYVFDPIENEDHYIPPLYELNIEESDNDNFDQNYVNAKLCGTFYGNVICSMFPKNTNNDMLINYSYTDPEYGSVSVGFGLYRLNKTLEGLYENTGSNTSCFQDTSGEYYYLPLTVYLVI